jgi:hypothetical protein
MRWWTRPHRAVGPPYGGEGMVVVRAGRHRTGRWRRVVTPRGGPLVTEHPGQQPLCLPGKPDDGLGRVVTVGHDRRRRMVSRVHVDADRQIAPELGLDPLPRSTS